MLPTLELSFKTPCVNELPEVHRYLERLAKAPVSNMLIFKGNTHLLGFRDVLKNLQADSQRKLQRWPRP
jgi:hypothetical protein